MYTYIKTSSCTSLYPILICLLSLSKDKEKRRLTEEKKNQNKKNKKKLEFLFLFEDNCLLRSRSFNISMIQLMHCKATIPSFFLYSLLFHQSFSNIAYQSGPVTSTSLYSDTPLHSVEHP